MKIRKKSIFRKKKFLPKLDRNFMADMIQIRKNLFLERKISYGNWTGILWQISGVILEWQKKIGHLLSVAPPSTECTKYPFWNVDNLICKQVYNHSMSFLKTKSFSLAALSKKILLYFCRLIDWFLLNLTQNMQSLETTWIKNPFTAVATFLTIQFPGNVDWVLNMLVFKVRKRK